LLTLLGFGLVAALVRSRPRRLPRAAPVTLAVIIAVAGIVAPLRAIQPVPHLAEQRRQLLALRHACHRTGTDAAIVVLQSPTGLLTQWAPQTLRGWCNVPVAAMVPTAGTKAALGQLAASWARDGRRLWVVAGRDTTVRHEPPTSPL